MCENVTDIKLAAALVAADKDRWVTKDGRRLLLAEMSKDHLTSCITLIENLGRVWRARWLPKLRAELARRAA